MKINSNTFYKRHELELEKYLLQKKSLHITNVKSKNKLDIKSTDCIYLDLENLDNLKALNIEKKYERIFFTDVLENLHDIHSLLTSTLKLLTKDGKLFVTAAVWAAHIDHIFLYKSAEEVRKHIKEAGLNIENELVQAVFEKDESNPEKEKIPVSYAAILS